jgi:hypothetical protein
VIASAEEFARLRQSDDLDEQHRASWDCAPVEVWLAVIERFPDLRWWVAHNKTVPLEILELLRRTLTSRWSRPCNADELGRTRRTHITAPGQPTRAPLHTSKSA